MSRVLGLAVLLLSAIPLHGAESDAAAIEATILARHIPFGTILNPMLGANGTITGYTRCGDSALFTGHYLAAEAFRYKMTFAPDALANIRTALDGLKLLTDVTGNDLLARCAVPVDSPYAPGITSEEKNNGVFQGSASGRQWYWIGNTSRDQYSGVFFGLGASYDLVGDAAVRASIVSLTTRLLDHLIQSGWTIVLPDRDPIPFALRPDEILTLLQVGRHVNPAKYASEYARQSAALALSVTVPLAVDAADDHSSYFKFNLAFISLYNLIRLEDNVSMRNVYERGFNLVRNATNNHLNPHFNMIDYALHGANASRDAETRADLDAWLKRPRTDVFVDLRGTSYACGDLACHPLPVELRPPSDFLWQLNPFQLFGGGGGTIETAGIDYILPYWMARFYGVIAGPAEIEHTYHDRRGR